MTDIESDDERVRDLVDQVRTRPDFEASVIQSRRLKAFHTFARLSLPEESDDTIWTVAAELFARFSLERGLK